MNDPIFILLGTNLGARSNNLMKAKEWIASVATIVQESAVYETAAWGIPDQPDFYNQALHIQSNLDPEPLLQELLAIELRMGRERMQLWGNRIIDIDMIFYGSRIVNSNRLTLPHPGIPYRRFVLQPLHELAPDMVHPTLYKTITQLLAECSDPLKVHRL